MRKFKIEISIGLIFIGIYLCVITLDPFLHTWDESFHALVAKNFWNYGFSKPILRAETLIPFNYKAWCCNHIWLHKQPLFLWQMALSIGSFGPTYWAPRVPSAIMLIIMIFFIRRIAIEMLLDKYWSWIAAIFVGLSFPFIERLTGRLATDHNDIAFCFYVTGSLWALVKYMSTTKKIKWCIIIGVFVGGAILNKWLIGLLIYSAFPLLYFSSSSKTSYIKHLTLSVITATIIALPWQLYTRFTYPLESIYESNYNREHIFKALERHSGSVFFHITNLIDNIGYLGLLLIILGALNGYFNSSKRKYFILYSWYIFIIFSFFTVVQTKMPGFTLSVFPLIIILLINGLKLIFDKVRLINNSKRGILISSITITGLVLFTLLRIIQPVEIYEYRSNENKYRESKIHNTKVYKKISSRLDKSSVVFNCKEFEDIDFMYYTGITGYHWWPSKEDLNKLKNRKIIPFKSFSNQIIPKYLQIKASVILQEELK